jgi:hypothetical protein
MGDGRKGEEEKKRREAGAVLSRATRGSPVRSRARQQLRAGRIHGILTALLSHRLDSHTRHRMTRF